MPLRKQRLAYLFRLESPGCGVCVSFPYSKALDNKKKKKGRIAREAQIINVMALQTRIKRERERERERGSFCVSFGEREF